MCCGVEKIRRDEKLEAHERGATARCAADMEMEGIYPT